jgi:uncharacterized protein (TIGR00251 family)
MRMDVRVVANADKDEVKGGEGLLTVRVKAPARDNNANLSVVKLLSRHFNRPVRMVSGFKSKRKVVEIPG